MNVAEKLTTIAENEPKVYNAGQISVLKNSKYMHPTVSGEVLKIDDMSAVPHKVSVTKRSDTVENLEAVKVKKYGKNLLTAQEVYSHCANYSELVENGRNCVRFTDSGSSNLTPILFKPNTQYTVSFWVKREIKQGEGFGSSRVFVIKYTDGTADYRVISSTYGEWIKFTTTSQANKTIASIGVDSYHYLVWVYVDVDTFQFEEGTTATEYEPYSMEYVGEAFDSTPKAITLIPDTSGVTLECEYLRDIDKYIDSLNVAVAMTGGA